METGTPKAGKSRRALLWTSTLYFGEGLPWSFLHQMATEFLTQIRASNTQISSTSGLHLAVVLKFLWSPIIDLFGQLRSWTVVLQIVLGAGMILMGKVASPNALPNFWTLLSVVAVIHAMHDIACDGFYIKGLDRDGQALYSGTRLAAYRVALLVGSGGLVFLASKAGWKVGFSACGVLMIAVGVVNGLVLPYPSGDSARARRGEGGASVKKTVITFLRTFWTFLTQPQAIRVILFMFLYKLGDIMMFTMSKPLLRDIGVDLGSRALLNALGPFASIAGSLVGGGVMARRGFQNSLIPMTYVQNLAILLYVALAAFAPPFPIVLAVVVIEQFASGLGNAAHSVFLMRRSRSVFSTSHYAFATAVVALGSMLFGWMSGPLNTRVGHVRFFTYAFLASVPALILVLFVPRGDIDAGRQPEEKPREQEVVPTRS